MAGSVLRLRPSDDTPDAFNAMAARTCNASLTDAQARRARARVCVCVSCALIRAQ
jgi:hypothetical protein